MGIGVFKKHCNKKLNIVLQREYLITTPEDERPILATESVRGCYAILLFHPAKSAIVHWDDNTCHLELDKFVQEFTSENIHLTDCTVTLIGGWQDNDESIKSGNFIKDYFEQRQVKLVLDRFQEKKSTGSYEMQGFSWVALDVRKGNVSVSDDWKIWGSFEDGNYRGIDPSGRQKNMEILNFVQLQHDQDPHSGSHLYARDKLATIQHTESNKLCIAAKENQIANLIQYIDEGVTNVNIAPSNAKGWTALHFACRMGNFEAAHLLINNGANLYQKNNVGNSPLSFVDNPMEKKRLDTAYKVIKFNMSRNQATLQTFSIFSRHKELLTLEQQEQGALIQHLLSSEEGLEKLARIVN